MTARLGGLYDRRNLRIRGRKQAGDLLRQCRIGRQTGELALPQIEVSPGQLVEFTRQVVLLGAHAATITHCRSGASSQPPSLLVALRHRR
ncbi:MAG: hypothetical protein JSR91_12730 [Proteobacteria bacterium]|nr:hypothetical protein [Pseudomonadota bacterium]